MLKIVVKIMETAKDYIKSNKRTMKRSGRRTVVKNRLPRPKGDVHARSSPIP
jgi:hypothetical protein